GLARSPWRSSGRSAFPSCARSTISTRRTDSYGSQIVLAFLRSAKTIQLFVFTDFPDVTPQRTFTGNALALRLALKNQIEKIAEPCPERRIEQHAAFQMLAAHLGIGHAETLRAAHHPTMHHGTGQLGVKLQAPGIFSISIGLIGVGFA